MIYQCFQIGKEHLSTLYEICSEESMTGIPLDDNSILEKKMAKYDKMVDIVNEKGTPAHKLSLRAGQLFRLDKIIGISAYCLGSQK